MLYLLANKFDETTTVIPNKNEEGTKTLESHDISHIGLLRNLLLKNLRFQLVLIDFNELFI